VNGDGAPLADAALAARAAAWPPACMRSARRLAALTLLVTTCHLAVGCGPGEHRVPKLTGQRLDLAEDRLDRTGLGYHVEGGFVVIRSHWRVVAQRPRAGVRARSVTLYVEHDEDEGEWDDE
jgi:hypothetical protein